MFKDTSNVPKIIFPTISNKDQLRKILNVNQWDNFDEPLFYKLKLAAEIFFNRYIYYNLKDITPFHVTETFYSACKYGNMEIVQLMIVKGVDDGWVRELNHACIGGHLPIVNIMIERIENMLPTLPPISRNRKKANNWNNGLVCACMGGHLPIVNLMIEKGADDWNYGLQEACTGGHLAIVKLMIEKIEMELSTLPTVERDENSK